MSFAIELRAKKLSTCFPLLVASSTSRIPPGNVISVPDSERNTGCVLGWSLSPRTPQPTPESESEPDGG